MNFLDLMDPEKRRMIELMHMQQFQQQFTPEMLQQMQAMGSTPYAQPVMPQSGQAGYGVLAPTATPEAMNKGVAGAEGVQGMGQMLPGLLSMAANLTGGADQQQAPAPPPPPPTRPVGTSKDGLPQGGRTMSPVERKRKFRRQ